MSVGRTPADVPDPSPPVGHTSEPPAPSSPLTPREVEVLRLVADGLTNDRAAAELCISAETMQSHVRNAMAKLDADSQPGRSRPSCVSR